VGGRRRRNVSPTAASLSAVGPIRILAVSFRAIASPSLFLGSSAPRAHPSCLPTTFSVIETLRIRFENWLTGGLKDAGLKEAV